MKLCYSHPLSYHCKAKEDSLQVANILFVPTKITSSSLLNGMISVMVDTCKKVLFQPNENNTFLLI